MVKKSLIAGLTAIILSLCCGLCFAAEGNSQNSINLGNEITKSVDKAGQSMQNLTDDVFSGNMVDKARNGVMNITNSMTNGATEVTDDMRNGMNRVDDGVVNVTGTNGANGNMDNAGNYDVTRTTAEGTTTGVSTMSTTTWMWIILAVAAVIIVAAVWYYATQNNE